MKRFFGHALAGLALLGGAGMIIAACSHDNSSIFVQDVLAPQLVTTGNLCTFTAQTTQPVLSSGVLDLAFLSEYNPTYLVGNQLVPEVNSQQLMTETDVVNISSATVIIQDTTGKQLATFTRETASTIYPSSGGVPSYAPITVTTIDSTTVQTYAAALAAKGGTVRFETLVSFNGQTLGGDNVTTGYFAFPVDICEGCLISFSATDVRSGCAVPNCLNAGTSSAALESPCVPGQDIAIDCSLCLGIKDCQGAVQTSPACSEGDGG
jgi:hypothetical protein